MNDPVKIVDRTFMNGVATAIYAVQTAEAGTAYMSVARSNHGNEKRVVIIVDAGRFRAAWRAATGPAWRGALHRWFGTWRRSFNVRRQWLAHLPVEAWRTDYKMRESARHSAQGQANPVPMTRVGLAGEKPEDGIAFGDGTTRLLWLLVNGAQAFPVECRASEAEALQKLAGYQDTYGLTVQELLGDMSWSAWLEQQRSTQQA